VTVERARELLRGEEESGLRALGGLLLATGVLVTLFRRTELGDPWGDFPIFLILFVTAVFLYGTGFLGALWSRRALSWHIAFVTFGLVLIPFALYAFLNLIDGDSNAPLNTAWVFLVTAVAGFAAAVFAQVRIGLLLGGLALVVSWLGLWDAILSDGIGSDLGTLRGLLVLAALILLALAAVVATRHTSEGAASDLVTVAGLSAVVAGALSFGALSTQIFSPFAEPQVSDSLFWDLELFVVTFGLLIFGVSAGRRGPTYVGVLGLIAFIYLIGFDADSTTPSGSLLGWPLVLLVAGGALLAFTVVPTLRRRQRT
jgi:hypothetical protein